MDLARADRALEEVQAAGILVPVGFQRLFDPDYRAARESVRSCEMGDLYLVRALAFDKDPPALEYLPDSGGLWRDQFVHDFDIVPGVTRQTVDEVFAAGVVHNRRPMQEGEADTAAAVFRLSCGALAVVSGGCHNSLGYDVRLEICARDCVALGLSSRSPLRSAEAGTGYAASHPGQDFLERFTRRLRARDDGLSWAPSRVAAKARVRARGQGGLWPSRWRPSVRESRTAPARRAGRGRVGAGRVRQTLVALGGDQIIVGADRGDTRGYAGRYRRASAAELDKLAEGLHQARERSADLGLRLSLHPHFGTLIEALSEVEWVLQESDIDFCWDSGHLMLGGTDPARLTEVVGRVAHVHLKDIDLGLAARVRSDKLVYSPAVAMGLYRALGDRGVALVDLVWALEEGGYRGWYALEQDLILGQGQDDMEIPRQTSLRSLDFLHGLTALQVWQEVSESPETGP